MIGWVKSDGTRVAANEDTPLPVAVSVTAESTAEATAAAPSYTEGQDAPLSQDRAGNLRTRTDDGKDVAQGTTTDAPVTDNTTVASATAATGIALWKRIVNLFIAILAKLPTFGTAGTASTNVITVQGIASGTPAPVTGTITAVTAITNALPAGTNRIGVTPGSAADNAASTDNPHVVGGVAVSGASYAPGYTAGDVAQMAVDKDSGGVLSHIRALTRAGDAISADAKQLSTVSTATPAVADATVFTLAAGEKGFIQNLSADAPLAYKLGASASTSSFNSVLNCGAVVDDGKGGNVVIDDFLGAVSVAKITGTARYIAYKLS